MPQTQSQPNEILLDSRAKDHIFQTIDWFTSFRKVNNEYLKGLYGAKQPIKGKGKVIIHLSKDKQLVLQDIIYIPDVDTNCISTGHLKQKKIF